MTSTDTTGRTLLFSAVRWAHANGWRARRFGLRHVEKVLGWVNADGTVMVTVSGGELVVDESDGGNPPRWTTRGVLIHPESVPLAVDFLVACRVLPAFFSSAFAMAEEKHEDRAAVLEAEVERLQAANASLIHHAEVLAGELIDANGRIHRLTMICGEPA